MCSSTWLVAQICLLGLCWSRPLSHGRWLAALTAASETVRIFARQPLREKRRSGIVVTQMPAGESSREPSRNVFNSDGGRLDSIFYATGTLCVAVKSKVMTRALSPDGGTLAAGCNDGTVALWDVSTGSLTGDRWNGSGGPVRSVVFSPDRSILASGGGYDGRVFLWDVKKTKRDWNAPKRTCWSGELSGIQPGWIYVGQW